MSRAAAAREKIKALQRKKCQLIREEAKLMRNRQRLILSNALLTAWCEALTLMQVNWKAAGTDPLQHEDAAVKEKFQQLLDQEVQLLNELTISDRRESSLMAEAEAAVLPDPGPDTLSPGDPMRYFRAAVAKGPDPNATSWSCVDVATKLRETVLMSSLHINMQKMPGIGDQQQATAAVQQLWDRYLRDLMSLVMLGREHVGEGIACYNLETMQASPEHAAAAEQATATLPPKLNLTDVQKDIISVGAEVCQSLTEALHKQREEVLTQLEASAAAAAEVMAAIDADSFGSSRRSGSGNSGGGSSMGGSVGGRGSADGVAAAAGSAQGNSAGSSRAPSEGPHAPNNSSAAGSGTGSWSSSQLNGVCILRALNSRQQHLETQQQLAARLQLLMAKEYMLIFTMVGMMVGCLTYEQLSLLHVLTWPYTVRLFDLAQDIHKLRMQELSKPRRQQQQQQQQQQQRMQQMQREEETESLPGSISSDWDLSN